MKHGFMAGFASALGGAAIGRYAANASVAVKVAANAVVGETVAELGGGKFANGAVTGAFVMLFNHLMHDVEEKRMNLAKSAKREWNNNSDKWATKNNYPKCSTFVHDMLIENDMAPYDDVKLLAGVWGDSNSTIPGWEVVTDETIQAGDVAAYKLTGVSNATGHVGILVDKIRIVYAGSHIDPDHIVASYLSGFKKVDWVYWRYIGK